MSYHKMLFILCLLSSTYVLAQPKLEVVGGTERSWGTAYKGEKVTHTVTLKNIGLDTLKISNVTASCGCTAAMASSYRIAPKDTSTVTITFNSKGYQGPLTKAIHVMSNDTSNPNVNINFNVTVLTVFELTPPFLAFVDYKIDSSMTKTIRMKNTTTADIVITKVTSKDSQATAQIRKRTLKPGEETELVVKLLPKRPIYFEGDIELSTDYKPFPLVIVSFNASMKKD